MVDPASALAAGSYLDQADAEVFTRAAVGELSGARDVHTFCARVRWLAPQHEADMYRAMTLGHEVAHSSDAGAATQGSNSANGSGGGGSGGEVGAASKGWGVVKKKKAGGGGTQPLLGRVSEVLTGGAAQQGASTEFLPITATSYRTLRSRLQVLMTEYKIYVGRP